MTILGLPRILFSKRMREIEVKAKVRNKDAILAAAKKLGIHFGEPFHQDDTTYENDTPRDDPRWNIFRIRKQSHKTILTMKYHASSRSRDNHERETVVQDADQIVDMLARVGYTPGVRISKTRRIAKFNGLEICLDEVESLGTFIEAEELAADDADVDAIQAKLWGVLLSLGVHPDDRTLLGYDLLMREHLERQ